MKVRRTWERRGPLWTPRYEPDGGRFKRWRERFTPKLLFTRGATGSASNSGGSSVAVTLTLTAGRSLVVIHNWATSQTGTITSITCSNNSNLTLIGSPTRSAIDHNTQFAYLSNIGTGGSQTVTVNMSVAQDEMTTNVLEYIGGDTTGVYDNAVNSGSGNSANPSISLTTNTANALIVGCCGDDAADPTAGSGYTIITIANFWNFCSGEDQLDMGAAGAKTVAFTAASGNWIAVAAAFKIAGGAAAAEKNFLSLLGAGA